MALMKCMECGNDVSTQAKACPKCGAKVSKPKKPTSRAVKMLGVLVAVAVVAGAVQTKMQFAQFAEREAEKSPEQKAQEQADRTKHEAQARTAAAGAAALKGSMKDPLSFDLTSLTVKPSGAACYEYRAKNGFGATFPSSAVLSADGKLLMQEQPGGAFASVWNRECTVAGGTDITARVKKLGVM